MQVIETPQKLDQHKMVLSSYEASGVPINFVLGNDGLPYAVLPNEYEAEDYLKECPELDQQLYCCGGFYNGVRLSETLGM